MRSRPILAYLAVIAVTAFLTNPAAANAQPTQWSISAGGNGHWYQVLTTLDNWSGANTNATGMLWNGRSGYLTSLTSRAEDDFVQGLLPYTCQPDNYGHPCFGYWIGAFQDQNAPDYAEPSGGWRWTSGETFAFSNWAPGEPNNTLTGRNDNWALMYSSNPIFGAAAGHWNDDYLTAGFVVEFDDIATVPEPSTYPLVAAGLVGLGLVAGIRRRTVVA